MTTLLLVLLALETVALAVTIVLYRRLKKANKTRRVEAPNSSYKSKYVMDLEAQDRWERLDLDRLHEVNREEMVKILAKVREGSIRALSQSERDFLDRMADAHDRAVREGRRPGGGRRPDGGGGPASGPPSHREIPGTS
jgi:hypothetical protein